MTISHHGQLHPWTKPAGMFARGCAIALIVFHNYFHALPPKIGENEFGYQPIYTKYLEYFLEHPGTVVQLSLAFWGWIAVGVFVVLSAYGMTVKSDKAAIQSQIPFLLSRFKKLYPVFFMAIIIHFFLIAIHREEAISSWLIGYIAKLSLLTNFIPGYELKIVGPWWFFSLIFQMYIVVPSLIRLFHRYGNVFLLALTGFYAFMMLVVDPYIAIKIRMTVIGWLPEISLGIYWASASGKIFKIAYLIPVVAIFIMGNTSPVLWIAQSVTGTFILMYLLALLFKSLSPSNAFVRWMIFLGTISLPIFAINAPIRSVFLDTDSGIGQPLFSIFLSVVFLLVVTVTGYLCHVLDQKIQRVMTRRSN